MLNSRAQICCSKAKAHILRFEESGNTDDLDFAFLYLIKADQIQSALTKTNIQERISDDPAGTDQG